MSVTTNVWDPPDDALVQSVYVNFTDVEVRPTLYLNQEMDTARVFAFEISKGGYPYYIPGNSEAVFHYVEYGTGRRVSVPAKGVDQSRKILYVKVNGDLIANHGRGETFIRITYHDQDYIGSIPGPDLIIRPIGAVSGNGHTLPDHIPVKALVVKEEVL